jgi:fatty acid desaturase
MDNRTFHVIQFEAVFLAGLVAVAAAPILLGFQVGWAYVPVMVGLVLVLANGFVLVTNRLLPIDQLEDDEAELAPETPSEPFEAP